MKLFSYYRYLLLFLLLLMGILPAQTQDGIRSTEGFKCLTGDDAFVWHIEQGAFFRGRRDYRAAYQEYNCAINLNPRSVLGYRGRGVSLLEQGNYQAALADFAIAIDITPLDPYLYNARGWAFFQMGDPETALLNLDRAIELDPNYAVAFNNRGLVERSMADIESALRDFQIAIDLGYPDRRYVPYFNMGDTYEQELGDLHAAARWYEEAAQVSPGQLFIHQKLGETYLELGMWREAANHYEQVVYLGNLDHSEALNTIRFAALREFVQRYTPTLLIIAIALYFALTALYRRWRQYRQQIAATSLT